MSSDIFGKKDPLPYTKEYWEAQWNMGAKMSSSGDPYKHNEGLKYMEGATQRLNIINSEELELLKQKNTFKIEIPGTQSVEKFTENYMKSLFPNLNIDKNKF